MPRRGRHRTDNVVVVDRPLPHRPLAWYLPCTMNIAMTIAAALVLLSTAFALPASGQGEAEAWVEYRGASGPGLGKRIVLVSGDEEYRSEEALPQLGKILAARHGFDCRVVFAINPATGEIDPNTTDNIPGLEALAEADLMIIATRFRDLPDEQMSHIAAYLRSGKPVIGLRTATHAFNIGSDGTYADMSWNAQGGGFGRKVLGETWIAHHGHHGEQSTRGVIAPDAIDHPIVRGIAAGSVWGPTDVYRVRLPLPEGCTPIMLGQVLKGMEPEDEPAAGEQNTPMMPVAWTRRFDANSGKPERVFTTTMGAATDLEAPGTRRMLVNAVYWALGMESEIPEHGTDMRLVGSFEPSAFGFDGFRPGLFPADFARSLESEE
ncbi:MAG: ThuA domain-containing protein [Phycisphaerales bacterium JB054]